MSAAGKLMPLAEAVDRFIHPGSHVHVGYADARPNAALLQIGRRFLGEHPELTISSAGFVGYQHGLLETGIVRRLIVSFAGENYPSARPNRAVQRAIAAGRVTIENWSMWSLLGRLVAAALDIPFLPVKSLAGSDMAKEHLGEGYIEFPDPTRPGATVGAVTPLRPDVVVLQGVAADPDGNVVLSAPYGEGIWGALAARDGVIACVEKVVDAETLRANHALVRLPAHRVVAVCEVPFGAHPYGLYNPGFPGVASYAPDSAFLAEVFEATRKPETFGAWIDDWFGGTASHQDYLDRIGAARLAELVAEARPGSAPTPPTVERDGWTTNEYMIAVAARRIRERVTGAGHEVVLAGVGHANLASWLAVADLDAALMAEIGMFDYQPRPGEPFIFSHHNTPTCAVLSDVMTVLGSMTAGSGRSLGVIGAAQLDQRGNTNSTYTADGGFLVGSGGANDICAGADEVLVTVPHGRQRLVAALPYITCAGDRVSTVVTSAAVFERAGERFRLTRYLPEPGETEAAALERIRAGCDWDYTVADTLVAEPPPEPGELATLRAYDPEGIFIGGRQR